jgi:Tfp pilus assembly protein PilN
MSTINLLPGDYLQQRRQHRGNMICAILFAIVIASICGAAFVSERSTRRTREVSDRMNAAYADAAKLIDEVHQLEKQKTTMLDKAKRSASLMEKMPRSYLLAMLTNALPQGASLKSVRMTIQVVGGEPEAQKPKGKGPVRPAQAAKAPQLAVALSVTGKATTDVQVARFIARLAAHPLTDVVDLSYSKESRNVQDKNAREFQLTVMLRPDADVLDAIRNEQAEPAPEAEQAQAAELTMGESR